MNFANLKGITIPEGTVSAISVGSQVIWQAIEKMRWTTISIGNGTFYCVIYDGGIWVSGSYSGKGLYYSTDG